MTGISEWADCMADVVSLASFLGDNDYGKPTHGTPEDYLARVVNMVELITTDQSLQTSCKGHIWFGPPVASPGSNVPPAVTAEDKITLPDGSTPNIMRVDSFTDEDGDHHVKVYFR